MTSTLTVSALVLGLSLITQQSLEFEVASIKRNISGAAGGETRRTPDGTLTTTNISIRNLLAYAWRPEDGQFRNLPDWAIGNRYDVTVKPPAGATPEQVREMWRALFRGRLKLVVHEEMRDTAIYALVLARADGTLGPQIKRSPHDCAALDAGRPVAAEAMPPRATLPAEAEVMATCGSLFLQGRMMIGGMEMFRFASQLSSVAGRLVEDRTGLEGYYAVTLTYTPAPRSGADVAQDLGDAPSIFTALREQLGLKLEPARKLLQTIVIDRIEPPSEN